MLTRYRLKDPQSPPQIIEEIRVTTEWQYTDRDISILKKWSTVEIRTDEADEEFLKADSTSLALPSLPPPIVVSAKDRALKAGFSEKELEGLPDSKIEELIELSESMEII